MHGHIVLNPHWLLNLQSQTPCCILVWKAVCLSVCYSPSPERRRESCNVRDLSQCKVLSAASWTDWITVSRDLGKTLWTSTHPPVWRPPLWTALAMEVTNHWVHRGPWVPVHGYINLHVWVVGACGALASSTLQKKLCSLFSRPF